jgi:prevent-host-death family protein
MELTVTATEFKAKCLDFFERLRLHKLQKVTVTKRGRPVAVVMAPASRRDEILAELQSLKPGTVIVPPDFDWFAPLLEEPTDAERGILHR